MAARLATTVGPVRHPETGEALVLLEGSECPAWAEGLLDRELLVRDEQQEEKPEPRKARAARKG